MGLRFLKIFLGFSAACWGITVIGVFLSWPAADALGQSLGARSIAYDPMVDYWLRMVSGVFGLIGVLYFIVMLQPRRYHTVIPWFGWLMVAEGMILLVHGLRLSLPPYPFYADVAGCLIGGGGILCFASQARPVQSTTVVQD